MRGNEISLDTVQINTKVLKEGKKKFADLFAVAEEPREEGTAETPKEGSSAPKDAPSKESKEKKE